MRDINPGDLVHGTSHTSFCLFTAPWAPKSSGTLHGVGGDAVSRMKRKVTMFVLARVGGDIYVQALAGLDAGDVHGWLPIRHCCSFDVYSPL